MHFFYTPSRKKFYNELCFKYLESEIMYFVVFTTFLRLSHLDIYLMKNMINYSISKQNITISKIRFFPSTVIEWNKLDLNICSAESFKGNDLNFKLPSKLVFFFLVIQKIYNYLLNLNMV